MEQMLTGFSAFDPKNVRVLLGGYEPSGYATDSMINITLANDIVLPYGGLDGDVSLAVNRNHLGTMTIHLQNTSPSNKVLSTFIAQSYSTGIVAFPVLFSEPSSGSEFMTIGWVQQQPEHAITNQIGTMPWVIGLKDARVSFGTTAASLNAIQGLAL
jgi:hypothetical protein